MKLSFFGKNKHFLGKYQKCVLENLEFFLGTMIAARSVNLNKQKDYGQNFFDSDHTKPGSHYQRLIRFMRDYSYTNMWFYCLEWSLSTLKIISNTYYLDATEWQFGKIKIHVLVLCVNWQGTAIPVYFRPYWHKGVLSQEARIRFIRKALKIINLEGKLIVADREFIGNKWFLFLSASRIKFVMRLRENMYKDELLGGDEYEKLKKKH